MVERDSSRSLEDAHKELQRRWLWLLSEYRKRYPKDPYPRISNTYRNKAEQDKAFADGNSKVKYPDSCHNSLPSLAIDYYFEVDGKAAYPDDWMQRVMALSQEAGLFSGGLSWGWDKPHIALCETPKDWPKELPPLPGDEHYRRLENSPKFVFNAPEPTVFEGEPGQTLLIRVGESGRVDARFDDSLEQKVDKVFAERFPSLTQGEKMQTQDTARIAKLNGMANRAESPRTFSLDETEPIMKYVSVGGNVVAMGLSAAVAYGVVNLTDLQINLTITFAVAAVGFIYSCAMGIGGWLARRQTYSQKTVAEDLHDMRASTKR